MTETTGALDAVLAEYVAGTLPAPAHVLVSAHLEMSSRNRAFVDGLESLAGAELARIEPVRFADRDGMLARIFALPDEPIVRPVAPVATAGGRLPPSIRRYLGHDVDAVRWRTLLPGVREFRFAEDEGCAASLYWIRAGRPLPSHTHGGTELTLVIEGGFADSDGHYVRGEIALADDEVDHRPVADLGEDCLCFAVTDAPLRLTGPIGRLIAPFMR
jgi:putative transcriptional regulator